MPWLGSAVSSASLAEPLETAMRPLVPGLTSSSLPAHGARLATVPYAVFLTSVPSILIPLFPHQRATQLAMFEPLKEKEECFQEELEEYDGQGSESKWYEF